MFRGFKKLSSHVTSLRSKLVLTSLWKFTASCGIQALFSSLPNSIQVKAPLKMNWEQDVFHCGLSFVKLGPFVIPTLVSSGTTKDKIISLQRE